MSNGYELYENQFGVHTLELNLKLSGFDEYRECAAKLYSEGSEIIGETGKGVWQQKDGTICDYRTYGIRLHLEGFCLAQAGGLPAESDRRSESAWRYKNHCRG